MYAYLLLFLASCQLVDLSVENAIVGLKDARLVGGVILSSDVSTMSVEKVAVVKVSTVAENVTIDASDRNRERVEVITIDKTTHFVRGSGKIWIDVLAIDFKQNIFLKETKTVELSPPEPPKPPTPPQPPTPPTPDVPGDKFGNIGQRIATVTKGLLNNAKLGAIYKEASTQLGSNPAWTIDSSSAYVNTELKKLDLTGYQPFLDTVNSDLRSRWPVTRGVAVDYWGAIAIGLGVK
jgi:hypothetical protein